MAIVHIIIVSYLMAYLLINIWKHLINIWLNYQEINKFH